MQKSKYKIKTPLDMISGTTHKTNQYGMLKVIHYHNKLNVDVEFLVTGFKIPTYSGNIRSGEVKDKILPSVFGVGFIGVGKHSSRSGSALNRKYIAWTGMIERCYCPKSLTKRPTYADCTVCDEWLNYQNFAEWHDKNYIEGFQLDKDIKIKGNRVYSPATCMFVSAAENTVEAHARDYVFTSPKGDIVNIYNLKKFCNDNDLDQGHMSRVYARKAKQHKGWTKA